jgi:rSAM/selenodomain-associated transferase 2
MPTLTIVIPTLNAAASLPATLKSLGSARVIVSDGGSTDGTLAVAESAGAETIRAARGRGAQLAAGARAALNNPAGGAGEWLLFLHADTVLGGGWHAEAARFCADIDNRERAAVFRFALADDAPAARRLEKIVAWRTRVLGLPYGDQGLLIRGEFYHALGGMRALPLMEDVDLARRIGRRRLHLFDSPAVTSAARYRRSGYLPRSARNLLCLLLYFLHVPPRLIARLYG